MMPTLDAKLLPSIRRRTCNARTRLTGVQMNGNWSRPERARVAGPCPTTRSRADPDTLLSNRIKAGYGPLYLEADQTSSGASHSIRRRTFQYGSAESILPCVNCGGQLQGGQTSTTVAGQPHEPEAGIIPQVTRVVPTWPPGQGLSLGILLDSPACGRRQSLFSQQAPVTCTAGAKPSLI